MTRASRAITSLRAARHGCVACTRTTSMFTQVHEWDGMTPREETLAALQALIDSGKVQYVGVSDYAAWQLMKALWIAERARLPSFVSQQIYYSLHERSVEYGLVPLAVDQGLGMLVWNPLAGGWLSGKYRRDRAAPEGSRRLTGWDVPPVCDDERLYDTSTCSPRSPNDTASQPRTWHWPGRRRDRP